MTTRRVCSLLLLLLTACSERGAGTRDSGTEDGGGASDAAHVDAAHVDAAHDDAGLDAAHVDAGHDDASATDAGTMDATTLDAGFDPRVSHPPAGATLCGHGAFSASDATMGCMAPSFVLDDTFLPDGGVGSVPRACSALTTTGGVWEVWCSPGSAYVWARFDEATSTGALGGCPGASVLAIDEGIYDTGSSGGNTAHVSTYLPDGTSIFGTPPDMPQTAVYEITLPSAAGTAGTANLFLLGNVEFASCGPMPGPPGPSTVLSGLTVTWTAP